jgi:phosphoribosylformylglycinamidine cyclo-ligase
MASYENAYNGGMGSNGLTSARHDVFNKALAGRFPESYDTNLPESVVYTGGLHLQDKIAVQYKHPNGEIINEHIDAGKLVLSPTRTYAPILKQVISQFGPHLHGLVHCSGGAQTKVLHFINEGLHVVKDNLFELPMLFKTIQAQSQTSFQEMYKVFNMGHRMEIYVNEQYANDIINISRSFNVDAKIIGRVEKGSGNQVTVSSAYGEFVYH